MLYQLSYYVLLLAPLEAFFCLLVYTCIKHEIIQGRIGQHLHNLSEIHNAVKQMLHNTYRSIIKYIIHKYK